MERNEPTLLEFGPVDDQSVFADIAEPQSQRFRYPQTGGGEQAEQCDVGERANGADRPERSCRRHQSCVSVAGETLLIAGSVAGLLPLDPQALHSVFLVGDDLSGKR